jgi:DNA-binding NarL/FixJ family response regulator
VRAGRRPKIGLKHPHGTEPFPMDKIKTFIVEDSSVVRENLIAALEESAPIDVIGVAEDEPGAIAWLLAEEHRCELVIVDIFLRSGTGLGVLKGIQGLTRETKRVVLSNHATPDIRAKCLELGADEVFDKSNELEQMLFFVNRLRSEKAELASDDSRRHDLGGGRPLAETSEHIG